MKNARRWLLVVALFPVALAPTRAEEAADSVMGLWEKPGKGADGWDGVTQKTPRKTRHFLSTGFVIPARLENAIYSYNMESPAVAIVERDVKYLNKVVIPAGTRIIGSVAVAKIHDRVGCTFNVMVFPDGEEIHFLGMALSLDGSAGIKGKVEAHKDSAIASTVLKAVVMGTQAAVEASGFNPITAQATAGVSHEAVREIDLQSQHVTASVSVSVEAETGIRIFVMQRVDY